jgi:glycosyltransferase involved in cell wall biosynthesis
MDLSVIIPAYNEEKTIGTILKKIFEQYFDFSFEVIVVDDGSADGTAKAVDRTGLPVRYFRQEPNQGKGAAIRRGLEEVKGDYTIIQDADCEYDPGDYQALLQPLLSGKATVVYGSRIRKSGNSYSYARYYWGGRLVSLVTNVLYGSHITDEPTCYKVFKTGLLQSLGLVCRGFEFCPEVTAKILKKHIPIVEIPISYIPRTKEEGKKICWKDGVIALWTLLKLRFSQ